MAFRTEFEFTLPRGYLDGSGRLHRKGVMRLATAKDEILPLQDVRVRNNRSYLVVILLSRVLTRLGELEGPEINPGVVESLFSADLAYLQEFYRQVNEEGTPQVETRCPSCAHPFKVDLGSGESAPGES